MIMPQHEIELPVGARKSPKNGGLRRGPKYKSDETLAEFEARAGADKYRKAAARAREELEKADLDYAKADERARKAADVLVSAIESELESEDGKREDAAKKRETASMEATEAADKSSAALAKAEEAKTNLWKTVAAMGKAEIEAVAAEDAFRRRNGLPLGAHHRKTYVAK